MQPPRILCDDGCGSQPAKSEFLESLLVNLLPRQLAYYPMYFMEAYPLGEAVAAMTGTQVVVVSRVVERCFCHADMSQYKNLFYSTRLPFVGKDELKVVSCAAW
jgi:hypothetical protein